MPNSINDNMINKPLKINQANAFYNYALGFDSKNIDLLKTGAKLLESGVSTAVFFSDFNYMYLDKSGNKKLETITRKGREFDSNWELEFSDGITKDIASDLLHSCEIAFYENRIQNQVVGYLRVCLPPIFLEYEEYQLPLFTSVKIYTDGIAILTFQLDATWDSLDEKHFLSDIVNVFKYYFKSIWIDSVIQKLDAKVVLNNSFEDHFAIGGHYFTNWKVKKLIKKSKRETKASLEEALQIDGRSFNFSGKNWVLHEIVGTENDDSGELTVELCREIYCNAISSLLVSEKSEPKTLLGNYMWQGRPSIALLSFEEQPETKEELYNSFSHSISKILLRADNVTQFSDLPPDLRVFDDFCLHGNRAILLWTWLKSKNSSENVWEDANTRSSILGNQARAEQIEYYNLKIARACAWAQNPFSNDHLLYAYRVLASSDSMIHQSSKSGEIIDALTFLMEKFGTTGLVNSSKESARYHLDELRYKSDQAKSRSDSRLTFIFGLVGAASLAQFAVYPFVEKTWPLLSTIEGPVVSIGISGGLIILLATIFGFIDNKQS